MLERTTLGVVAILEVCGLEMPEDVWHAVPSSVELVSVSKCSTFQIHTNTCQLVLSFFLPSTTDTLSAVANVKSDDGKDHGHFVFYQEYQMVSIATQTVHF